MRWMSRAVMLTLGVAVALTVATPPSGAAAGAPLAGLETASTSVVPADFAKVMGYEPKTAELVDGSTRLINPKGACSVPGSPAIGQPFDFEVACQAHDFGYDLLRYASRTGAPMDTAAREDIDALLTHDLHTQCSGQEACDATVTVFQAAVGFNSWRQVFGPPIDQSGLPRTAGLIMLGMVGVSAVVRRRVVKRRRLAAATG